MKKILLIALFGLLSFASYSQYTKGYLPVADRTTTFKQPLPTGSLVLQLDSSKYWILTGAATSTTTLATASKIRFTPLAQRAVGTYMFYLQNEDLGASKFVGQYATDGTTRLTSGIGFAADTSVGFQILQGSVGGTVNVNNDRVTASYKRNSTKNNAIDIYKDSIRVMMNAQRSIFIDTLGNATFDNNITVTDTAKFTTSSAATGTTQTFTNDIRVTGDVLSDALGNSRIGTDIGNGITTGHSNSILGYTAGYSLVDGHRNTLMGHRAGNGLTSGYQNVFIGKDAGFANATGNSNIFIGYRAGDAETGSNKLYIENSNSATPLIYGDFSTDKLTTNGDHYVTDSLFTNTISPYSGTTTTFPQLLTVTGRTTLNDNMYFGNGTDSIFFNSDTLVDVITMPYMTGNIANSTTTLDTVYTTYVSNGTFTEAYITVTLADDATYNLPNAKTITATIMVNADDNLLLANVTTAGVVTLAVNSGTDPFANSDSDTDYCLYDGGTFAVLKNRNGAPATFYLKLMYNK